MPQPALANSRFSAAQLSKADTRDRRREWNTPQVQPKLLFLLIQHDRPRMLVKSLNLSVSQLRDGFMRQDGRHRRPEIIDRCILRMR
jgi:hypothetical protein